MRINLIAVLAVVATLHTTKSYVVSRILVAYAERELSLEKSVERTPVNLVVEVDAVGKTAFVKTYVLIYLRVTIALCDAQRLAQRTVLNHCHAHVILHLNRILVHCRLEYFPCRPCLRGAVVEHYETYRLACGYEFLTVALVNERRNVTELVNSHFIYRVLNHVGALIYSGSGFSTGLHAIYREACCGNACVNEQGAVAFRIGNDL